MSLEFNLNQTAPASATVDCVVVGAYSDGSLTPAATALDTASSGKLKALVTRGDVSGKTGATALLHDLAGVSAALGKAAIGQKLRAQLVGQEDHAATLPSIAAGTGSPASSAGRCDSSQSAALLA